MDERAWLETVIAEFRSCKDLSERAAEQVGDEDYFRATADGTNSLSVLVKHMGGNLRSRWTEFLTTDGEKPDRHRELEFETEGETRAEIEAIWQLGWQRCLDALAALDPADLERTVLIRSEPHAVVLAIHRGLAHAQYHAGQIVQLARHFTGDAWRSLSIPRGESEAFNAAMREKFGG